jgi:hypothetical protein
MADDSGRYGEMELFGVVFILVIGVIAFAVVRAIAEAISNSGKPLEQVPAEVVAKRTKVSGGMNNTSASTTYYTTFEDENGIRTEFRVPGPEFGMLAEGDRGILRHQGTWFKGFSRTR